MSRGLLRGRRRAGSAAMPRCRRGCRGPRRRACARASPRRTGAGLVPGQHDDQRPADGEAESPPPASGLAAPPGQVESPGQPRVAQVGVRVLVEPGEVPPCLEQPGLDPAEGRAPGRRRRGLAGAPRRSCWPGRAVRAAELHPAQPAVAVPDRQGPPAAGAPGLAGMLVPPDRARAAAAPVEHAPGQAVSAAGSLPARHLRRGEAIDRRAVAGSPSAVLPMRLR